MNTIRRVAMIHDVARLCLVLSIAGGAQAADAGQVSGGAAETSLRCAASDPAEQAKCADSVLKRLHARVAVLYEQTLSQADDPATTREAQRRWIAARDACPDSTCIKAAYVSRIDELERATGGFDPAVVNRLCVRLADPVSRNRIVQAGKGATDINNDGVPDMDGQCPAQSPNGMCAEYHDKGRLPLAGIAADTVAEDRNLLAVQAFRYAGKTLLLSSLDNALTHPAYLSYVSPSNHEHVLCEFKNEVQSPLKLVKTGFREVCEAVAGASPAIESIALAPAGLSYPAFSRMETSALGLGIADVDNDGTPERVVALEYSSAAARGCSFDYFDLVSADGTTIVEGEKRRLLLTMQGIDTNEGFRATGCGVVRNRLFRYDNRVYYEHNTANIEGDPRSVWLMQRQQIKQVCWYGRRVRTVVK